VRLLRARAARVALAALVGLLLFVLVVPVVQFEDPLSTVILDRDGELLGASIAADGQWRFGVSERLPDKFVTALTRFEDRRFFWHPGVDPVAVVGALVGNLRRGEVWRGGSTLTMQVVRLSRKGRARTYREKLIETVLALRLEMALSKRQILSLYAAYAPFGGNTVGLDAAAWRYFGHDAFRLSWAETAMLAVLPNAPSLVHPGRNRQQLLAKRNRLLRALRDAGAIDALTCQLAEQEDLPPAPQPLPRLAPHLLARIQKEKARAGRRWRTGEGSPWVRTTLRKDLQVRVAGVLERHQARLAANGVHNAAALVLDVDTGRVAAYVGNIADFGSPENGAYVDVIPAARSTGSILKPFLFAAMLDAGEVLPGQIVPDVPTHLGLFHPENFDRAYAGAVPAEQALARSLNVPAVRMLRSYGVDRFCGLLRRLGMTTLFRPARHYGLSLILGGAEGSLQDITAIYAGLARSLNRYTSGVSDAGVFHPAGYLLKDDDGSPEGAEPPLHAGACYLTAQAMLEVERPGDESSWRAFSSARKVAWKTGTSYGFRDAWAVGFTPRQVVGVWVGNADGEGRQGLTGYSAAAPILFEIHDLLPPGGWFAPPEADLWQIEVCAHSGMRLGPHCTTHRTRLVTRAGLGSPPCTYCRLVHSDPEGKWQVHSACQPVASIVTKAMFVLPPAMEWYYRRQHASYQPPPPYRADCLESLDRPSETSLACVYPKEGAQVYVPIEMNGKLGRVVFEAAHRDPHASIFWHLDDRYVGETRDIHQMELAPPTGRHVLTLVDDDGEMVERRFVVLGRSAERALRRQVGSRASALTSTE